jgi:two-component system LytT family sensor kinase
MDKVSTLVQPDSTLRGMHQSILPITVVIWLAHWGILVSRAYALGIDSSWGPVGIRAVVSFAGALSCLLIYKLLQHRRMKPATRLVAAFLLSLPAIIIVSLANEFMWLVCTEYFSVHYGFGPQDVLLSQCLTASSPCQLLLVNASFTAGTNFWVYIAWCAFYVAIIMAADLSERERRLYIAERAAQEAQLSALRFQLNPHFMFNTLNTLSGLIALDRKQQAADVVLNLSSFLRFSLQSDTEQLISLDKEIEAQRMYGS